MSTTDLQQALSLMSSNSQEKAQALTFLEEFQKTKQAWDTTIQILNDDNSSLDLKMFSAQTLRNKLTYDLGQIPTSFLPELKTQLIHFLIKYHSNKPIITQLSISLVKLSIQFLEWNSPVDEIIQALSSNLNVLLEFLKILPEETLDPKGTPLTDEEFKYRTEQLIVENVDKILSLLSQISSSSSNTSETALILDCLNSWIKEIPIEKILSVNSITNLIFQSLSNEELFENSIDCLISIIRETKDFDNYEIIQALYEQIIKLKPLLEQYNDDPDIFGNLTRLFVEAGESWHMLIVKNHTFFKPIVEILLTCSNYSEDLDIVKYTFYFWYVLKQMLVLDRFKEARAEYQPIYSSLIHVMINHLKYPDTPQNKEDEDKFKDFRYDMGDVLKDCTAVVGSTEALIIPFEKIQSQLSLSPSNLKWQEIEAPLFSLRTMAKEVSQKENIVLPKLMDLLVQLPEHTKIRYAATLVLGRYTEWTSKHPEFLEKQLNYIINGFQQADNDIINAASHALMYFCQDCSNLLVNYIEQLYQFYSNLFKSDQTIDITSFYEVTEGISHIIDKQEPSKVKQILAMFIEPIISKLSSFIDQPGTDEIHRSIAEQIEIIRIFFEVIRPTNYNERTNPVSELIIELWPMVLSLLSKHGSSVKVSERCMKFTKTLIQSYNQYLIPILPSIANVLVEGFANTKYGCYLWVSGVVIKEFGDDFDNVSENIKPSVWNFAYQQVSNFLVDFKNYKPIDIPDLIDDFFRMMMDILTFFVPNFILSDILQKTFDVSLLSLNIEKFEPLISNLRFLIDLVSWGFDTPPLSIYDEVPAEVKLTVRSFVEANGELLVNHVLQGLIFKFPVDAHPDSYDLLMRTLRLSPSFEVGVNWLNESLNALPENTVGEKERSKLVTTVGNALNSKDYRRIRLSLKDFVTWYSRKNVTPRFQN